MMLINIFKKKIESLLTDVKSDESDSRTIDVVEEGESSLPPEDEWRDWPIMPLDPATGQVQVGYKTKDGLEFHENGRLVPDVAGESAGDHMSFTYREESIGMPNRPSSVEIDAPGADKDLAFGLIRSVVLDGLPEGVLPSCKLEDYGSVGAMLLALSEVPAPVCRVDDAPHPGDKASNIDPWERFAAAARVTGPLFGFVGRVGPYEIDEPLDAWLSVVGAMKISSLASSVEMGSPSSLGVLDPYWRVYCFGNIEANKTAYVVLTNLQIPSDHEFRDGFVGGLKRGGEWTVINERIEPGTAMVERSYVRWCKNDTLSFMETVGETDFPGPSFVVRVPGDALRGLDESSERVLKTEESLASHLVQDMTEWFSRCAGYRWRRILEPKRQSPTQMANGVIDYGRGSSFDLCVPDAATRLWVALAKSYSVDVVKICEHCGRPFADTANGKSRCCSEECTRAKNARNSRKRANARRNASNAKG